MHVLPAVIFVLCHGSSPLASVSLHRPQVIPIIDIPGFGTAAAEKVCTAMKIQSQVRRSGGGSWGIMIACH